MEKFTAKIIDPIGLHARPASKIVQVANTLSDDLKIYAKGKSGSLKSILSIMALGVKKDEEITIEAEGSTAKESLQKIKEVMKLEKLI